MKSPDPYLQHFADLIQKHGHAIQYVAPTKNDPPGTPSFGYTVGLTNDDLPEILVYGIPPEIAQPLLNHLARDARERGGLPLNQDLDDYLQGFPVRLQPIPARNIQAEHFGVGLAFFPHLNAVQLVWPDQDGVWPWSPQARERFKRAQPLICEPPTLA